MRGDTWCALPALTVDGYLPCTCVKKGWHDTDTFTNWVIDELLPLMNPYPAPKSIICLDNVNTHHGNRLRQAVEAKGCILKFLPPYSPDYNPTELTLVS